MNIKSSACTSVLVGKKASLDGSTLIARNDDTALIDMPIHFVIRPATDQAQTIKSFLNGFNAIMPAKGYRYQAVPRVAVEQYGVYEESGFNEKNVGMSATESIYGNEKVLAYDPLVVDGIDEDTIVQLILPYIDSARAGVERLGKLIARYGSAAGNGVLFSDVNEVWYMEIVTGHFWVAQRIPDDAYVVTANQVAIQQINFSDKQNFAWAIGIQTFVQEHHLNPDKIGWNFRHIFGTHTQKDHHYNTPRVWYAQQYLDGKSDEGPESDELPFICYANHKISVEEIEFILGSHFNETEFDPLGHGQAKDKLRYRPIGLNRTQSSHILQARSTVPIEQAAIMWLAVGYPSFSPFVAFYANAKQAPGNYRETPLSWTSNSAYWLYRTLPVLVESHYDQFKQMDLDYLKASQQYQRTYIVQTNLVAEKLAGMDLTNYLTKRNEQLAKVLLQRTEQLIGQLVTQGIYLSQLTFDLTKSDF